MSDAKAKAEERRKKILARANKHVAAVGGEDEIGTEPSNDETSPAPKVNPLKQRREMIAAKAEEAQKLAEQQAKVAETSSTTNTPAKHQSDKDPEVESIPEMTKIISSASINSESAPKKEVVYIKKTMKEIEAEVAINTQKFDEDAMKKEVKKESSAEVAAAVVKKPKLKLASNVQPSSIMRLIRLLLIVLLGVTIGFQTVKTHKDAEVSLTTVRSMNKAANQEVFDEFAPDAAFINADEIYNNVTPTKETNRTWLGYIQFKIQSQVECTITAVGLIWWISRSFSPFVNNTFKVAPQPGGTNIMTTLLTMYQNGFEGVWEIAYSALGELALFVFVIVVSVVGFTALYTDTIIQPNMNSAASSSGSREVGGGVANDF